MFKEQFARREGLIHLNNAGLSPITKVAKDRVEYWVNRFYQEGYYTDADYTLEVEAARTRLAELIGCEGNEIAWFTSTASAISQFAFQVGLQAGDEVLMWDQEYASSLYPFKQACDSVGANLVLVSSEANLQTPTDKFIAAITSKTKIVAFSSVQFSSGARMDTKVLIDYCKQKQIITFADVIQELGIHPLQVWQQGIDALAGGSHKWLASPVGIGFLAIRKNLIRTMKPHSFGSATFGSCDDAANLSCEAKVSASKFEPGSKQVLEIVALGASCELISKVGVKVIESEAVRLANLLISKVKDFDLTINSPFKDQHTSPMVNIKIADPKKEISITSQLQVQKINFAKRGGGIRFSPHAFNTDVEIFTLADLLKSQIG